MFEILKLKWEKIKSDFMEGYREGQFRTMQRRRRK